MKCNNCGFENKDAAKFCTKCGASLNESKASEGPVQESNTTKYAIIALIIVIIVLVACLGYFMGTMNSNDSVHSSDDSKNSSSSKSVQSDDDSNSNEQTSSVSSSQSSTTKATESKSWVSIGSYSGSGSGSQTIEVPAGEIMVKLSAYPIKNYATNHLYVTGSNGQSGGVDWGSHSDVETRSDSFTCTLSSTQTFTIDYYETVSWEVEFYRYQ